MPPTHAKKPAAMRQMCAHGGPTHCSEGCYAEGGDVDKPLDEPMKDDGDEELENTLAGELLHAVETKDKKGIRDAIEALVLQCMNKGGSDV